MDRHPRRIHPGYSSLHLDDPAWLVAGSAVFGFVVTAPFVVATLNVPKQVLPPEPVPVAGPPTEQPQDAPPA